MRRILAALVGAFVLLMASSPMAAGHVSISPDTTAGETFATFTFTVPNEEQAQDTVGLDVSLPPGFLLQSAEAVPGWTTEVETGDDGIPTAIHWSGGRLTPHTFGEFSMRGRLTKRQGTLSFSVVQRYEAKNVSWSGPADSEQPAPVLTVSGPSVDPTNAGSDGGTPQVPVAPQPAPAPVAGSEGRDDLARSRAGLALMLALAAILVPLSIMGMVVLRRRAGE